MGMVPGGGSGGRIVVAMLNMLNSTGDGMFVYAKDCGEETLDNGVKRIVKGCLDDLMLVEWVWNKGVALTTHSHPHRQCGYVAKGSFEVEVAGKRAVLRAGDCYYTEAGEPHGVTALEDGSVLVDVFTPKRDDFLSPRA